MTLLTILKVEKRDVQLRHELASIAYEVARRQENIVDPLKKKLSAYKHAADQFPLGY